MTDVFAIQDEISRGIVNTLRLNLSPGRRRYEANLEAYDLYLRGRHLMASFPAPRGRPIALPAVQYFEQAIAKDGNYAIAYAGMADALIAMERNVGTANPFGCDDPLEGKGCCGTGRQARPDALRGTQRGGLDSRPRIRVAGGRAGLSSGDRPQSEQCAGPSGARDLGARRAGTFRRGPSGSASRVGPRSIVPLRQYGSGRGAHSGGTLRRSRGPAAESELAGSKPDRDRTTCSAARSRCRGNQTRHSRRSTRASSAALPTRSGGRVPKCVRDDATRRSVSCNSNSTTPVHRGLWRGPMRASAIRSARSNIWRSRSRKTDPVSPRSFNRPSSPRCARTRGSRRCGSRST